MSRTEFPRTVIRLSATAGPDGVLHLTVPVAAAGEFEVAVVVTPKPATAPAKPKTPEELGWPPGFFENVIGSIDDPAFKRYPQGNAKRVAPLDAE